MDLLKFGQLSSINSHQPSNAFTLGKKMGIMDCVTMVKIFIGGEGGGNMTCRGYGYVSSIWVGFWSKIL